MNRRLLVAWSLPVLLLALSVSLAEPRTDRLSAKKAAARIDTLVEQTLKEHKLALAPLADDATFVRRTYLAIVGRIPTAAESQRFIRSQATDKSLKLVDELLESKGRASHMFNWFADLLRPRTRLARRTSGEPYAHWLKESLETNKPYDQMVHELLAATGPVHARGNGATGYMMRDRNMPEDNMSNTIRLFLGSRVECAQCHNHPFDKWTQKQYFEMVAFTGGIQYQKNARQDPRAQRLAREAQQKWGRNGMRALRRTMEPAFIGIYGSGTAAARLPKDYQYDDAKPRDWVEAHPIFAPDVRIQASTPDLSKLPRRVRNNPKRLQRFMQRARAKDVNSRETFADWMTSPHNERFAMVIANRLWKQAFGRGLVEPVDDMKDDSEPVSRELLEHLTALMVELEFDLREFQRVLYYSRLWRREAVAPQPQPGSVKDLRGPLLRRMTAEQAWDSLLALVVDNLDNTLQPALSARTERVYAEYERLGNASDDEILEQTGRLVLRYTNPEKFRQEQRAARAQRNREVRAKRQDARPLYQRYARFRKLGDTEGMADVARMLTKLGLPVPGGGGRALRDLARASDLQSPAPGGHLLRDLGQSERELIQASHTDPTVPQVLALLNAFIEQRLLTNKQAVLMRDLGKARGATAKITHAFRAVLGRSPTSAERSMWQRDVARGPDGVQDLVWTLVNTHEFLFIQ